MKIYATLTSSLLDRKTAMPSTELRFRESGNQNIKKSSVIKVHLTLIYFLVLMDAYTINHSGLHTLIGAGVILAFIAIAKNSNSKSLINDK